ILQKIGDGSEVWSKGDVLRGVGSFENQEGVRIPGLFNPEAVAHSFVRDGCGFGKEFRRYYQFSSLEPEPCNVSVDGQFASSCHVCFVVIVPCPAAAEVVLEHGCSVQYVLVFFKQIKYGIRFELRHEEGRVTGGIDEDGVWILLLVSDSCKAVAEVFHCHKAGGDLCIAGGHERSE